MMDLTDSEDRQIEEAVAAALKAVLDLPIDLKCVAVDMIVDRVELELALWQRAQLEGRTDARRARLAFMDDPPEDDCVRLDRYEKTLLSLADRVLVIESLTPGIPLSTIGHSIAKQALKERRAPHEEARLRVEAFRRAQVEAEAAGSREPIDRFLQRLKRGEYDRHTR